MSNKDKKIKILFVASEFASGMIPFGASVINALADTKNFEVFCLCVNSEKNTYKPYIKTNANPVFIEYPQQKLKKIIYKFWPFQIVKAIKRFVAEEHPDIIHFITGDFSLAYFIRFFRQPGICYTVHDMFPHEVQNSSILSPLKKWTINKGYEICRDYAPNLTTSSKEQFELLKKMYPQKNIGFTNFPTLVTEYIASGKCVPPEVKCENSYMLFFGNVVDYKGVDLLISAFEKLGDDNGMKLVIAGKGVSYPIKNSNIIRINRFIDDSEVRMLFEKAKIVVYPYRSATMSGVLSLAFFFKKRILLSDVAFFRENEAVSTTFFKTGDVDDLVNKIKKMLASPCDDCEDVYEQKYSKETMVKSYISFYGGVCE